MDADGAWNIPPPEDPASGRPLQKPPTPRPRRRSRRFLFTSIFFTVIAAIVLLTIFVLIPRAEIQFDESLPARERNPCDGGVACHPSPYVGPGFSVGGEGYDTIFGSWNASVQSGEVFGGGYVLVTITSNASGTLYSSTGSVTSDGGLNVGTAGSFDVSGFGPFQVSVTAVKEGVFPTTVQGTALAWY
jgi:hypothetical protein